MPKKSRTKISFWQAFTQKLHLLFIPHEHNDYKPHILHPHRLLLHGLSAILIKSLVILALLSLPASAWLTPDVLSSQSKKIVQLTNDLRVSLGRPVLQENSLLNLAAFNKAQDMFVQQYFSHMSPENKNMVDWLKSAGYSFAAAGENLALGFSSADEVVAAWTKSKTHYANLIDPDFKEIGVAMVSGNFKTYDTTIVAQYFGTQKAKPVVIIAPVASVSKPKLTPVTVRASVKPQVKGEKIIAQDVPAEIKTPVVDLSKTKIWASDSGLQKDKIINVEAYLSADAVSAKVILPNLAIDLSQDPIEITKWTGSAIISRENAKQIFNPVILASLSAQDKNGNVSETDINWSNYQEIKPSLMKQYFFIKNSSSKDVKSLVSVGQIYLFILLIVSIISLVLNIFIEIKKQHPHIIFSALGLICLLLLLIVV